jgi:hypothetical protein
MTTPPTPRVGKTAYPTLPVNTTAVTPQVGFINTYDSRIVAGPMAITLPSLSSITTIGAGMIVEKYVLDANTNTITFACNGSDTFDGGSTNVSLGSAGDTLEFQVISRDSGVSRHWKIINGTSPVGVTGPQGAAGPSGTVSVAGVVGAQGPQTLNVLMLATQADWEAISSPDPSTLYVWFDGGA